MDDPVGEQLKITSKNRVSPLEAVAFCYANRIRRKRVPEGYVVTNPSLKKKKIKLRIFTSGFDNFRIPMTNHSVPCEISFSKCRCLRIYRKK